MAPASVQTAGFGDRLTELARAGLLDADPDRDLDRLARLARRALRADAATVTLLGTAGMRNVGRDGIDEPWASSRRIAAEELLLEAVVGREETIAVPDVTVLPEVRESYGMPAGAATPVRGPSGLALGALSVAARRPRRWSDGDLALLADLAGAVTNEIELRLTARTVARRERRAAALQHVLELISAEAPLTESLSALAHALEEAVEPPLRCGLHVLDRAAGVLRDVAAPSLSGAVRAALDGRVAFPAGGPWGEAAHSGHTVLAADAGIEGLGGCWAVPVAAGTGPVLGVLGLYPAEPRLPGEQDEALVAEAVHLARIAIERELARAGRRDRRAPGVVLLDADDQVALVAGVRALARAVDAKDPSTHRHSERVAGLAAALAQERGWAVHRVELLRTAALIHDVGKIGVPDRILLSSRALTAEEWALLREHPALGAQIADEVLSAEQVAWIGQHHERPDGLGYPAGLRGAQVAEGSRLLALADAWDAMTSVRPYHDPLELDEALAECRRCSGTQFAPEAVAALERLHAGGALEAPGEH